METLEFESGKLCAAKEARDVRGLTHRIARLPLYAALWTALLLELIAYAWVRIAVSAWELFRAVFAPKRRRSLRRSLARAATHAEWAQAAAAVDAAQGRAAWARGDGGGSRFYDAPHIARLTSKLARARTDGDVSRACEALRAACVRNCGGTENEQLYSFTLLGTQAPVQAFVDEREEALRWLLARNGSDGCAEDAGGERELGRLLDAAPHSYGRTALCLSGGGALAYPHLGVCLELLREGLLPVVVSGTSAGALVAALVCCRTEADAVAILSDPAELARRLVFNSDPWSVSLRRLLSRGHFIDEEAWAARLQWVTQGLTFAEAFAVSGSVLNISISNASFSRSSHNPQLLNYITAPNVLVYSAVLASAAMPISSGETMLLAKDPATGDVRQFDEIASTRWRDGCLSADIPQEALREMLGVRFTIVSQCNPHIIPFFFSARGRAGSPSPHRRGFGFRGGFLLSYSEKFLKVDMLKWLQVARDLDLAPRLLGVDWSLLFLQQFGGDCTMFPPVSFRLYSHGISDGDEAMFRWYTDLGRRMVWPKLSMIRNRVRTEQLLVQLCQKRSIPLTARTFASPAITPQPPD